MNKRSSIRSFDTAYHFAFQASASGTAARQDEAHVRRRPMAYHFAFQATRHTSAAALWWWCDKMARQGGGIRGLMRCWRIDEFYALIIIACLMVMH